MNSGTLRRLPSLRSQRRSSGLQTEGPQRRRQLLQKDRTLKRAAARCTLCGSVREISLVADMPCCGCNLSRGGGGRFTDVAWRMTYNDKWTEEPELVEIAALTLDEELFPRERLDPETVDDYTEQMQEEGARFPPIRVIMDRDGNLFLVDGWHRCEAARRLRYTKLHARVRSGDWSDAVEAAAASNTRHGLKRTNADKRKAVEMLLALPKWAEASDREIAKHCGITHPTVAAIRATGKFSSRDNPLTTLDPAPADPPRFQQTDLRRGADGKLRDVSRQGAAAERTRQQREMSDEPWGGPPGPWPTTRLPVPIAYIDIIAWLAAASDSERRRLADDAFDCVVSAAEKLKHDAKVQAWLAKHECGDAVEGTTP